MNIRLILINGPCGVGKSTTAKSLHALLPLSILVDVAALRKQIGDHRKHRKESRSLQTVAAMGVVDRYLKSGHDVILDKTYFDEGVVEEIFDIGREHDADIYEFILWADKKTTIRRAEARGYRETSLLTPRKCARYWKKMNTYRKKRSKAMEIDTRSMGVGEVVELMSQKIGIESKNGAGLISSFILLFVNYITHLIYPL